MDKSDEAAPLRPGSRKPALTRRGHPKRADPRAEDLKTIGQMRFPGGAPDWYPTDTIVRDGRGRFVKGAPTPNPHGARGGRDLAPRRTFGKSQVVKDVLELLDQPVMIRKGRVTREVPAITAIYDKMIHMAIGGDWNAMKKCVDLSERYSDFRERTLAGLLSEATACRQRYKDCGEDIPEHVAKLLEYVDARVVEGQFEAG